MSRYRKIDVRMYGDAKFTELSPAPPNAQTLWVFLLTGPHTTAIPGISVCGEAAMAEALGWDLEGFRKAFREVFEKGMVKADWKARVILIPKASKYNPPESPNVIRGWAKIWDEVPECALKSEALSYLKDAVFSLKNDDGHPREAYRKAFLEAFPEAFMKGFPKVFANQEQEQEQEYIYGGGESKAEPEPSQSTPLVGTPEERKAAHAAFDRWSFTSRGGHLREVNNEHSKINALMVTLAQGPPVIRGRESVPAHKLVSLAADQLHKEGKDFKAIGYACTCVKNRIEEWISKGMQSEPTHSSRDRPAMDPKAAKTLDKPITKDF